MDTPNTQLATMIAQNIPSLLNDRKSYEVLLSRASQTNITPAETSEITKAVVAMHNSDNDLLRTGMLAFLGLGALGTLVWGVTKILDKSDDDNPSKRH